MVRRGPCWARPGTSPLPHLRTESRASPEPETIRRGMDRHGIFQCFYKSKWKKSCFQKKVAKMAFFFGEKTGTCRCQTLRGWKRILQRWSSRSVPKVALKSPSMRDRRGSLPLLDMSTEALILARQLHMDFQEVKSIMYPGAKSQQLGQLGHSVRVDRCARLKEVEAAR